MLFPFCFSTHACGAEAAEEIISFEDGVSFIPLQDWTHQHRHRHLQQGTTTETMRKYFETMTAKEENSRALLSKCMKPHFMALLTKWWHWFFVVQLTY